MRVGIGEYAVGGLGDAYRVTLGSCVGLCLVWAKAQRFAVAHILLSSAKDGVRTDVLPSRFADTAVGFLQEQLGEPERKRDVVAYVAGGSAQFETKGTGTSVGDLNVRTTLEALASAGIRVLETDLGGTCARQLVVDGNEGQVLSIRYGESTECTSWDMPSRFQTGEPT